MLKEISKTIIHEVEKVTDNATYNVTYTVVSNNVISTVVKVFEIQNTTIPSSEGKITVQPQLIEQGTFVIEQSSFRNSYFPYSEKLPLYMQDLVDIVNEISKELAVSISEK